MINLQHLLLYIDPGTGGMLLTVILGVLTTAIFVVRGIMIKFKVAVHNGDMKEANKNKIPLVIYSDHKRYWNIFKPICDECEKREFEMQYWTQSEDDPALSEDYKYVKTVFIGEGNKGFARLNLMNANICLSTTPGLDVLQWKRSKNTDYYVHVYHTVGDCLGYRMFGLDYYDAIISANNLQRDAVRKLEELRGTPAKEICLVGSAYMDTMMEKAAKLEKVHNEETTVLLAPSWGDSGTLSKFGAKLIKSLINTGYNIIVRPHPQTMTAEKELLDSLMNEFPETEKFHWNFDNDNFNVLNSADIMISDFSGVIFDYAFIFDKPIIYTDVNYDTSPYDAAWIDEPMWMLKVLPSIGAKLEEKDFDNIKSLIDETIASDIYSEGRRTAKATAWHYQGESAVRSTDYLINKYYQLTGQEKKAE
ncbi:MAG: CDP-glycerol glycerophosphotransferase family protein [Lachnospiraceae bacterium]|nr:CDP-glycerol glycerophosphotransferase family protein [Lachnospiraceae bacterium]